MNAPGSPVETFKSVFNRLTRTNLEILDELYDPAIVFRDPLHQLQGLPVLRRYFQQQYDGVISCRFVFEDTIVQSQSAALTWTMHVKHRRFGKGQVMPLSGASHIRFREKVVYHCDYFDLGAFIYERLPLVGPIVRLVKSRIPGAEIADEQGSS